MASSVGLESAWLREKWLEWELKLLEGQDRAKSGASSAKINSAERDDSRSLSAASSPWQVECAKITSLVYHSIVFGGRMSLLSALCLVSLPRKYYRLMPSPWAVNGCSREQHPAHIHTI